MSSVINSYNPGGVNEAVLGETGRGGILSDGYLSDDPLKSYVGDDEIPVFVRSNARSGVSYERLDSDDSGQMRPGDGYRAFLLVTDTRLFFVIGDNQEGSNGDRSAVVPLADVQLVEASDGLLASELVVTTLTDVRWRFACTDDVSDPLAYLEVATAAWKRLENHLDDARDHLLDASGHREGREYDAAMAALGAATDDVAAARRREAEFVETGVTAMRSRIERTEKRVAEARAKTLEARATYSLDRAERLWREDDYEGAHEAFRAARSDCVDAIELAEGDFEDAETVRGRLDRVERNLAALERAPVERAERARERADEVDTPEERSDLLERALERYRRALELDWGHEEKRFAVDTDELRDRIDALAADLVEARRRLATARVDEGDCHREAGQTDRAAECYREARDLLDETRPVARELVPDAAEPVAEHREAVTRRLQDVDHDGKY